MLTTTSKSMLLTVQSQINRTPTTIPKYWWRRVHRPKNRKLLTAQSQIPTRQVSPSSLRRNWHGETSIQEEVRSDIERKAQRESCTELGGEQEELPAALSRSTNEGKSTTRERFDLVEHFDCAWFIAASCLRLYTSPLLQTRKSPT